MIDLKGKKKTIAMETQNQDVSNSGMVTPGHEQPGFAFQIELHNRGTRVRGAMVNLKRSVQKQEQQLERTPQN